MKSLQNVAMTVSKMTGRTGLALKAASPEILLGIGVIGVVTSTVLACRATLKVETVLDGHKETIEKIHKAKETVDSDNYSETDYKKDLTITYVKTGANFVKLYGPSVSLGLLSLGCIIGGHGIIKQRNVALMAAYKAVEESFSAYRKRVTEEYGENADYMYKNGLKQEVVSEIETDEDGKSKKVKKNKLVTDPNGLSQYARFFDESSSEWTKNADYNMMFLQSQQNYWNNMLQARGHVFLNEIYDALGLPRSQAGAVVGWVIGENRDNFIDFGLFDGDRAKVRDFVNGYERSILLDFNVDGVIYDLFTKGKD